MDKKKVLFIDDEEKFTMMIRLNLERLDKYEVKIENKGSKGCASAKAFMPDLIFLDILMPDMDGSQVAQEIQSDPELKDVPVIFLTAMTTKEEADSRAGMIGGCPFLAKPVSLNEIVEAIEKHAKK